MSVTDFTERMEKIKSTGYWRVNIRPIPFERLRIESLPKCWELVNSCKVYLRGWIYPAVFEDEMESGKEWVQCGSDYRGLVELWRFYQSGQFIDYFSCIDDYRMDEVPEIFQPKCAQRGLEILGALYRITEIFEFSARLAQKDAFGSRLQMSINLLGMDNRELFYADKRASTSHVCRYSQIPVEREFSTAEIIAEAKTHALDAALKVYDHFGWEHPPRQMLIELQQTFLEKRL